MISKKIYPNVYVSSLVGGFLFLLLLTSPLCAQQSIEIELSDEGRGVYRFISELNRPSDISGKVQGLLNFTSGQAVLSSESSGGEGSLSSSERVSSCFELDLEKTEFMALARSEAHSKFYRMMAGDKNDRVKFLTLDANNKSNSTESRGVVLLKIEEDNTPEGDVGQSNAQIDFSGDFKTLRANGFVDVRHKDIAQAANGLSEIKLSIVERDENFDVTFTVSAEANSGVGSQMPVIARGQRKLGTQLARSGINVKSFVIKRPKKVNGQRVLSGSFTWVNPRRTLEKYSDAVPPEQLKALQSLLAMKWDGLFFTSTFEQDYFKLGLELELSNFQPLANLFDVKIEEQTEAQIFTKRLMEAYSRNTARQLEALFDSKVTYQGSLKYSLLTEAGKDTRFEASGEYHAQNLSDYAGLCKERGLPFASESLLASHFEETKEGGTRGQVYSMALGDFTNFYARVLLETLDPGFASEELSEQMKSVALESLKACHDHQGDRMELQASGLFQQLTPAAKARFAQRFENSDPTPQGVTLNYQGGMGGQKETRTFYFESFYKGQSEQEVRKLIDRPEKTKLTVSKGKVEAMPEGPDIAVEPVDALAEVREFGLQLQEKSPRELAEASEPSIPGDYTLLYIVLVFGGLILGVLIFAFKGRKK